MQRAQRSLVYKRGHMQLTGSELVAQLAARWARLWPPSQQSAKAAQPSDAQLQAVLGDDGPRTFRWYQAGVAAASSVASVRQRLGNRFGSGFVVRAGDLGLKGRPDELLLLTNFHVVNPSGAGNALRPEEAEAVFEARDSTSYEVKDVVWSSPIKDHDACLLRLADLPAGIKPLSLAMELPPLPKPARRPPVSTPRTHRPSPRPCTPSKARSPCREAPSA